MKSGGWGCFILQRGMAGVWLLELNAHEAHYLLLKQLVAKKRPACAGLSYRRCRLTTASLLLGSLFLGYALLRSLLLGSLFLGCLFLRSFFLGGLFLGYLFLRSFFLRSFSLCNFLLACSTLLLGCYLSLFSNHLFLFGGCLTLNGFLSRCHEEYLLQDMIRAT